MKGWREIEKIVLAVEGGGGEGAITSVLEDELEILLYLIHLADHLMTQWVSFIHKGQI